MTKASCGWFRRAALSQNEHFAGQGESTPTEAEYGVSLPLEEVGVSRKNNFSECSGGTFLKLAIVGYCAGAAVAASFAIGKILKDSRPPYDHLFLPIGGPLSRSSYFLAQITFSSTDFLHLVLKGKWEIIF